MEVRRPLLWGTFALGLVVPASQQAAPLEEAARPPRPADTLRAEELTGATQLGLPEILPGIDDSPLALARLQLGRKLFFDPILSGDQSVSCASCHDPKQAFANHEALPLGIAGRRCARNAPTLFNRALGTHQFWDGRAASLEAQVVLPIQSPDEMGLTLEAAVQRLAGVPDYVELFAAAGSAPPDADALAAGLAEFVRRLVVGDSPIDRFRAAQGDLTKLERRGLWIFESKGRCWRCHAGPNFSDESFHNTGVGAREGVPEPGRFAVTQEPADRGRFKTPTLRMVGLTAPYMHDGSVATLEEVIAYYKHGGNENSNRDPILAPIDFTDEDVAGLVAFLEALSRRAEPPPTETEASPAGQH